jgi:hypothetical protein
LTKASGRETSVDDTEESSAGFTGDESDGDINENVNSRFEVNVAMLRDYYLIAVNKEGEAFKIYRLIRLLTRK